MRRVNEAWAVLGDPGSRRTYDAELMRAAAGTSADLGGAARGWRPIDDEESVIDPRLEDDDIAPGRLGRRVVAVAPASLVLAAVSLAAMAVLVDLPALWAAAVVALALAGALFVMLPLVAMAESRRRELG